MCHFLFFLSLRSHLGMELRVYVCFTALAASTGSPMCVCVSLCACQPVCMPACSSTSSSSSSSSSVRLLCSSLCRSLEMNANAPAPSEYIWNFPLPFGGFFFLRLQGLSTPRVIGEKMASKISNDNQLATRNLRACFTMCVFLPPSLADNVMIFFPPALDADLGILQRIKMSLSVFFSSCDGSSVFGSRDVSLITRAFQGVQTCFVFMFFVCLFFFFARLPGLMGYFGFGLIFAFLSKS